MRVAVIGGIGSGKSEVMKIAKEKGFFCLSADEINVRLLQTPSYISKIAKVFPFVVKDGAIDKKALARIVFSDEEKRKLLNSVAHPEIMAEIRECNKSPLAVELPLYVESGARDFDEVVLVKAPLVLRVKRLKKRGLAPKDAIARIKAQPPNRTLQKYATRVIYNGKDLKNLQECARIMFDDILESGQS